MAGRAMASIEYLIGYVYNKIHKSGIFEYLITAMGNH